MRKEGIEGVAPANVGSWELEKCLQNFSLGDRKCPFEDISHGNVAPGNVTGVFKMQIIGFTFQMCDLTFQNFTLKFFERYLTSKAFSEFFRPEVASKYFTCKCVLP